MVYLIVLIALLCLGIKGYCGKKTSTYVQNTGDSFLLNLIRMLICALIGTAVILFDSTQSTMHAESGLLLICLLSGLSNSMFLIGWILAIQKNSMVLVDVGLTIGSLLPAILCAILFSEALSGTKLLGYLFIIIATLILSDYSKKTLGKPGGAGIAFLVLAALGDGLTGFSQQLYKQFYTPMGNYSVVSYPVSLYHFYTYVFAALILLLAWLIYFISILKKRHKGKCSAKNFFASLRPSFPYIVIRAICLFVVNHLQTIATSDYGMPSQVLYPLIKGGCLITVNITAMLFFGEKASKRSIWGSFIALLGILILNVF